VGFLLEGRAVVGLEVKGLLVVGVLVGAIVGSVVVGMELGVADGCAKIIWLGVIISEA
jgi:hypothetical protein